MQDALSSEHDYYDDAVNAIQELLPSGDIHVLNSANSCLVALAHCLPEPILVPDMGGWNGFNKSCELFNKKVSQIGTIDGLINIEILNNYFKDNDVKSFYITSLAGYTAKQPLKEILKLCDIHEVILIVDISGSVGDEKITKYGDIQVSSTGSPKIINIENGGFINNITGKIVLNKHLLKTLKADNITCAGITNEITKAHEIEEKTEKTNQYLKNILKESLEEYPQYNIIHPKHVGLNTMITAESKSKAKRLAYNIRQRIDVDKNIITTGPQYNRVKKACVIIEVKNLDVNCLTRENMDKLNRIIIEEISKM